VLLDGIYADRINVQKPMVVPAGNSFSRASTAACLRLYGRSTSGDSTPARSTGG
jgi:hypothetical protein